jgi:hypothetical protein
MATNHEKWARECLSKKRYRTLAFAKEVAKKVKEDPAKGIELYPHACPNCQGFHLTKRKEYHNRYQILRVC